MSASATAIRRALLAACTSAPFRRIAMGTLTRDAVGSLLRRAQGRPAPRHRVALDMGGVPTPASRPPGRV